MARRRTAVLRNTTSRTTWSNPQVTEGEAWTSAAIPSGHLAVGAEKVTFVPWDAAYAQVGSRAARLDFVLCSSGHIAASSIRQVQ